MKKLLSLLGAIGLIATSGANVIACGNSSSKSDDNGGSNGKPTDKLDLASLKGDQLVIGDLKDRSDKSVIDAFNKKNNTNLTPDDLDITYAHGLDLGTTSGAYLKAWTDSKLVTGEASVGFNLPRADLSALPTTENAKLDLGPVEDKDDALLTLYFDNQDLPGFNIFYDLSLDYYDDSITITPITKDSTSATVTAKPDSKYATGSVDITFTIKQ